MRLPTPRGPISDRLVAALAAPSPVDPDVLEVPLSGEVLDEDAQLALWTAYELHYRGFDDLPRDPEWDPGLLAWRGRVEARFEAALRDLVGDAVARARGAAAADGGDPADARAAVAAGIRALVAADEHPSVARHLQRRATRAEVEDFLRERSLYHLKESDPHAFVLARIDGPAKVATAELLYDEYGAGRADGLHARLFAEALAAAGLDPAYGAHVDQVSAQTLASSTTMSLFGLHRRLRGAALGHLAAFEVTSTDPCRRIAQGIERVGLPAAVAAYFHEHVEADAVHEQVALTDICGALVADDPALLDDVLLGAAACLAVDGRAGAALLARWEAVGPEVPAPRTTLPAPARGAQRLEVVR